MTMLYPTIPAIRIDGQANPIVNQNLLSLEIRLSAGEPAHCEMNIGNWGDQNGAIGFLFFDRALIDFGKTVEIRFGPSSSPVLVFGGRIDALEAKFPPAGKPYITVLAEDRLLNMQVSSPRVTIPGYNYGANLREFTVLADPARQMVTGRGIIEPDPHLRVGMTINLQGLGPIYSGNYNLCRLRHLFDLDTGLRTEVNVERPG